MNKENGKYTIIGAGPSGLSLALALGNLCEAVFESEMEVGGHARSIRVDDWIFDKGPHILFSRDKLILDYLVRLLHDNVHLSRRNNKVLIENSLLKYPIENDLGNLDSNCKLRSLLDFVQAKTSPPKQQSLDLETWFVENFGNELTRIYFRPYNEKVWNVNLRELSMSWSERIPQPTLEEVIKGALGQDSDGYVHQLYYHYPLRNGFGEIPVSLAEKIEAPIYFEHALEKISIVDDIKGIIELSFKNGTNKIANTLVYTGPLHELPGMCNFTIPTEIIKDIDSLIVNSMYIVTLGYKGVDPNQYSAIYVPDPKIRFNRISFPTTFSPNNSPEGHFLVQGEVTVKGLQLNNESEALLLTQELHEFLLAKGLINRDSAKVFEDARFYRYAYVVYTNGYETALERIKKFFSNHGIILHGRFGGFEYINTDMCLLRSLQLAAQLRNSGESEYQILQELSLKEGVS